MDFNDRFRNFGGADAGGNREVDKVSTAMSMGQGFV